MKNLFYLLFLAIIACSGPASGNKSDAAAKLVPPNIIFIMADDLGYGDLGSYGQKVIQTPHIDQLAKEGMRFTQCYAGSPVCAPSRSVLMTGKHTGHTTVRGNFGIGGVVGLGGGEGRIPLEDEDITVAEVLKSAGYLTGMTGKWGLGEPNTSGEPNDQGFDEFLGFLNQRRAHSYYVPFLWKNDQRFELQDNFDGKEGTYVHDLFTEFALDFVERNKDTSFFLYLPYTIPHDKYEIPDLGIYVDSTQWGKDAQVHAAMVSRMDRDIGKLMELLNILQLDKNTLVLFCSDNGAAKRWEGIFDSSGPLKGQKRDLYEGGIRTPMIAHFPDRIPAGTTNDLPWHFMDVLPTLASIAGADYFIEIDGTDVSPAFFDPLWKLPERILYWEFYERGFQQAIRMNDWKGVKLSPESDWELYDLSTDPTESQNVAADNQEIIKELAAIAEKEHVDSKYFPTVKLEGHQ